MGASVRQWCFSVPPPPSVPVPQIRSINLPCHPEWSKAKREAIGLAESKGPYTSHDAPRVALATRLARRVCHPPELTTCRRMTDSPHYCGRRQARLRADIAPRRCQNSRPVHSISPRKRHPPDRLRPPPTISPEEIGRKGGPGWPPVSAIAALPAYPAERPAPGNNAFPIQILPRAAPAPPPSCTRGRLASNRHGRVSGRRRRRPVRL